MRRKLLESNVHSSFEIWYSFCFYFFSMKVLFLIFLFSSARDEKKLLKIGEKLNLRKCIGSYGLDLY